MSIGTAESVTHLDLDSAIRSKQLIVGFEPYVALRELKARGGELNLVWQHPQYGPLVPSLFMPFISEQGRSREITGFVLREALRAVTEWRRTGLDWTVSVNVPLEDLVDGTLPSTIGVLLDEFDLPPEVLTIDIGEGDLLARSAQALPAITGLRALGLGVALDSAPGEAMIQDLRGLPFTEIKVSGAAIVQFIDRTRRSGVGRVAARVYNARSNGIPVSAVGVDSEAMLWSVQRLDFDAAQGPYICQPTESTGLVRWEKIWRQAADSIRERKVTTRRPLAEKIAAPKLDAAPAEAVAPPPMTAALPVGPDLAGADIAAPAYDDMAVFEAGVAEAEVFEAADAPERDPSSYDLEDLYAVAGGMEPAQGIQPTAMDLPPLAVDADIESEAFDNDVLEYTSDAFEEPVAVDPVLGVLHGEARGGTEPPKPAESVALIARRLPGIDRPIVMSVQNHGVERFAFLKRFARKG